MLRIFIPIFGKIATDNVFSIKKIIKKTKMQSIGFIFIAAALLFAAFFFSAAAFFYIAEFMSPVYAAVVLGLFWLLLAVLAALIMKIAAFCSGKTMRARRADEQKKMLTEAALAAVPALLALSPKISAKGLKKMGIFAVLAGSLPGIYRLLRRRAARKNHQNQDTSQR